jgi:hypothetical protein
MNIEWVQVKNAGRCITLYLSADLGGDAHLREKSWRFRPKNSQIFLSSQSHEFTLV